MERQGTNPISPYQLKSQEHKVNLNPDYQRDHVWSKTKKMKLVASILKKFHMPELTLAKSKNKNYEKEVVDGKQRMTAIFEFMENKIKTPNDDILKDLKINNKYFNELPKDIKNDFESYPINYVLLDGTQEEIEEQFRILQEGITLTKAEQRNSISGEIKPFIKEMLKTDYFTKTIDILKDNKNYRKLYNQLAEQYILLSLSGITEIGYKVINNMYTGYNKEGIPMEN